MAPRDRRRKRTARQPSATATAVGEDEGVDETAEDEAAETQSSRLSQRQQNLLSGLQERQPDTLGGIEDLSSSADSGVSQEVAPGSNANLSIAPSVNPGFANTEVVNRMGLVLSLNLEYDPQRDQWVPSVVDSTERQAVEQSLAQDDSTSNLGDVVDTGEGTTIDGNGDLQLSGSEGKGEFDIRTDPTRVEVEGPFGIRLTASSDSSVLTLDAVEFADSPEEYVVVDESTGGIIASAPAGNGTKRFNASFTAGGSYTAYGVPPADRYEAAAWTDVSTPLSMPGGRMEGRAAPGGTSTGGSIWFSGGTFDAPRNEGTATTSFDNDCRVTSNRQSSYNVCSKSSDVTVNLWHREPHGPDSRLLAKDIDEREDISDIPAAYGNLQYEIILERSDTGESPKVERIGHQRIR